MSINLTLRPATADDKSTVVALWKDCGLVAPYNDPVADFRFARAKANSDVFVAVNETGMIVGSVMVGHDGHRGWPYYVSAHPDHRRRDIGRALMRQAENWLREQGILKIMLMVRDTNAQVVTFYERNGYKTKPNIVMEKWLKE